MKHKSWFKKYLLPRKPKNCGEYGYKIVASLLITFFVLFFINLVPDIGKVYGTYNPETDTIWISPDLENRDREIVVAHEEAHRAFYQTLPFYSYLKLPHIFISFLFVLGFLVFNKRLWYLVSLLIFVNVIPEIHAYGYTLLRFGMSDLTIPGLFWYTMLPLLFFVVAKWRFTIPSPKPRIAGFIRFRGAERKKAACLVAGLIFIIFGWGLLVGYLLFGEINFSFSLLFIMILILSEVWVFNRWEKLRIGFAKKRFKKAKMK